MKLDPVTILTEKSLNLNKKFYFISGNESSLIEKIKHNIIENFRKKDGVDITSIDSIDGFVDEVVVFSDSGNLGKIFRASGVLLNAATSSGHVVSAVDLTYNFTGNAPNDASKGKIRILFKYFPTAGESFSN